MVVSTLKNAQGVQVLRIEIPVLPDGAISESGKSINIATTHGNKSAVLNGEIVSVGVNVYKKNPDYKPPVK